ncbi:MAG: hypothetical protein EZS28_045795, partial [Streblomastix strix]
MTQTPVQDTCSTAPLISTSRISTSIEQTDTNAECAKSQQEIVQKQKKLRRRTFQKEEQIELFAGALVSVILPV